MNTSQERSEVRVLGRIELRSEHDSLLGSFTFTNVDGSEKAARQGARGKQKRLRELHSTRTFMKTIREPRP